ncbi:glycosyltransferase family 2 protein [Chryseobacterium sp. NKUCC03_KSP]|uniref:glycosyltransferase family 2 protein n=1 Tax=Chryseobacterium sp. NKUCC03_KSP TaxID=2842125 RepID=UPI001C5BDE73|nr:glycosyltransferase family 2 protein [Chryseobacterium sp. NKUCC03_KSP]MBW3520795.1 glycosyltransferase family 2 protein [Chryseobacterium sp. NKUCC03_KSP]
MMNRLKNYYKYLFYKYSILTDPLLKKQRKDPLSIPVIIINFNQLYYLEKLITFLLERKFENIIIIDNQSSYPPLLEYYKRIEDQTTIHYLDENLGHKVFYQKPELFDQYAKGYYFLTDADIVPNENLPENFPSKMLTILDTYFRATTKVGMALRIDDIPDSFPLKNEVLSWEQQFWQSELEPQVYKASIDTTFALYKPGYFYEEQKDFIKGIRIAGSYTSMHGGWYKDMNNLTEEEEFYQRTANSSSSWNFDNRGKMNKIYNKSYK